MPKILVIDDNQSVYTALSILFSLQDIAVAYAEGPSSGLTHLRQHGADLVIQDMNFSRDTTSGAEGIELFHQLRQLDEHLPIILLTAWTHLEQAVELVKAGAADYLGKPWDDDKLLTTASNLLALGAARKQQQQAAQQQQEKQRALAQRYQLCGLVYESSAMYELLSLATRVATADIPVLITGPNGSGKEKIAEIIQANSSVAEGPFIKVNAGALPKDLVESELFGTSSGAYTGAQQRAGRFEAAHLGTLFLDEIGNLPAAGQAKLLRVLQTGEFERLGSNKTQKVKVRIISATNANLQEAVKQGEFREDLYYRLNVIELNLNPLCQRREDILPLAEYFLGEGYTLHTGAQQALLAHPWPGNVRELQNTIKRAAILCENPVLHAEDLQLPATPLPSHSPSTSATNTPLNTQANINEQSVREALTQANGVIAQAAKILGMSRQAFYRRMEKYGIHRETP